MTRRRRTYRAPEPQAIDPASGFKVPLSDLVKQWDGEMIDQRFVDRRNPQDFVRGVKDNEALPFARPEVPDEFIASNILTEDFQNVDTEQLNSVVLSQGPVPIL